MTESPPTLERLLERATKGPWSFDERYDGGPCHIWAPCEQLKMVNGGLAFVGSKEDLADLRERNAAANAALIVAAVNALPAHLSELRHLRSTASAFLAQSRKWASEREGLRSAIETHLEARDILAATSAASLRENDPKFAAVADTLQGLRDALQPQPVEGGL